ncbi:MAG TPA: PEP-CTERM sorting domain-containing protein [Pyrinomonadaceae bacterium]|nr:PEP-CTERM sorting domain-containing protein [Pyrinomonadaceae bacterium]
MGTRFFRPLATMVSLLLLVAVPTQASPITFADVVSVMGDSQKSSQLRLRTVTQDPNGQTPSSASKSIAGPTAPAIDTEVQTAAPSLVAGAEVAPQQPQSELQVFEQDNVDGTICDCGEIPAGGGFPKWPFLFLAAIPLLFIHHHNTANVCPTCNTCPTCPTPTPTPPQVPEPTSLLLFGSGIVALTAGARRRYAKMRASKQAATMTEE